MKFKFKTQKYQTDAVNSVVDVFNGQPYIEYEEYTRDLGIVKKSTKSIQQSFNLNEEENRFFTNDYDFYDDYDDTGFLNANIKLSDERLLSNINGIQDGYNLERSLMVDDTIGRVTLNVEMETGTGKTYVYTRTIFELNKRYGWNKFIIVVPSIAIREGVKKSLEQTQEHFMDLYSKKIRFFIYNANNLGKIDDFSKSSSINVMIINIQAFNKSFSKNGKKESLIIYSLREEFGWRRPIDVISKNRPILILDEPQKMGGDATQKALLNFNPLFSINYSATHRVKHNLVYVLDALDAYNQKLVKKIEVKGFQVKNLRGTNSYLYLEKIQKSPNKPPRAYIELEINYKTINKEGHWLEVGSNLYNTSKEMDQYKDGYIINEINAEEGSVSFINGLKLMLGCSYGDVQEKDIRRIQIRETIISHLEKEEKMFKLGIKVLSLFFIDEVKKYRIYNDKGEQELGEYGQIFEDEYLKILNERGSLFDSEYNKYLNSILVKDTHKGYFSIDKTGHFTNSKLSREGECDDESAYDLILTDKAKLLSFEEPTRFIFSHSALREGWDNPNVFQICTLKNSSGDVQRHQEVGRGLRICVNKFGDRMDSSIPNINFHDINKLTVIANESYENFVKGLQSSINENLFDRRKIITIDYFDKKTIFYNGTNNRHTLTYDESQKIVNYLSYHHYIDLDGNVTELYKLKLENNELEELPSVLKDLSDGLNKMIKRIYDNSVNMEIENGYKTQIVNNTLNTNFNKKEFKELWDTINHRYAYTVDFDSEELINNSIDSINKDLNVTRLVYTVQSGEQKTEMYKSDVETGTSFQVAKTKSKSIESFANENIMYDLIGRIKEKTQLTRKTVARILKGIGSKQFDLFKINPEEFIKKISNLINDQKASIIVEHIVYNQTDEQPFDSEIFNQEKSKGDFLKAFKSKKSVQDYIFEDSKGEREFAEDLEDADEVVVYAKLPKGFYIPTPVGSYSPDWAIAFKKGTVKHVFFIAETKGSLERMQLRKLEEVKIQCAEKLFETISNKKVKYGKVTSYSDLISILGVNNV